MKDVKAIKDLIDQVNTQVETLKTAETALDTAKNNRSIEMDKLSDLQNQLGAALDASNMIGGDYTLKVKQLVAEVQV